MTPKLFDFQRKAVNAIFKYFIDGRKGHPLVVAPTGSGKSHIIAGFCADTFKRYPNEQVLILTHTKEIIQQNAKILRAYLPSEKVGVYSAGLHLRQRRQFTVASIQSVYRKANQFEQYRLVLVDEAHMIPEKGEGRYRTFFNALGAPRIVGLTATPFRRGHGMLTQGHIFDDIVYEIELQTLISLGKLAPLTNKATQYTANLKGVKKTGGDYNKAALSHRLDHGHITDKIVQQLVPFKDTHKAWLVFAIDIKHCEHIAHSLHMAGITAVPIHSQMDLDRQELLAMFKRGVFQVLVSVETLTTGFDAPNVDLIALLRPTASPVLHVQMLGRGMRTNPGKDRCLVLDFSGNVKRLGPVDAVLVEQKNKQKGKSLKGAPTKTCPDCDEIVSIQTKECPSCGYKFPFKSKLETTASDAPLLKSQVTARIVHVRVSAVTYRAHNKRGKKPTLKVTYICGLYTFYHEWIAFEHQGYPRKKAVTWWSLRSNTNLDTPRTVEEAKQRLAELRKPKTLMVDLTSKYPEILRYGF